MVELVDHLRLVERQVLRTALAEHVTRQLPAVGFEPFPRVKEVRVGRHVEQALFESNVPRIVLRLAVLRFPDQHCHTAVDGLGQFGLPTGTEDGASAGVGVEEANFLGRQDESAFRVAQHINAVGEEDELGPVGSWPQSASSSEQAKLVVPVDIGKEDALVLEVEQARKRSRAHHVLEEVLGRVVRGDTGGEHAADSAPFVQEGPHGLGEDGVEVDAPPAAKRKTAGVSQEMTYVIVLA